MIASSRTRRAALRERATANRLAASCRRRPRSLATHVLTTGADRATAAGCGAALRVVARRLGIQPVESRTRRTLTGGRTRRTYAVHHYTRAQVVVIVAAYRPRKPEYATAAHYLAA